MIKQVFGNRIRSKSHLMKEVRGQATSAASISGYFKDVKLIYAETRVDTAKIKSVFRTMENLDIDSQILKWMKWIHAICRMLWHRRDDRAGNGTYTYQGRRTIEALGWLKNGKPARHKPPVKLPKEWNESSTFFIQEMLDKIKHTLKTWGRRSRSTTSQLSLDVEKAFDWTIHRNITLLIKLYFSNLEVKVLTRLLQKQFIKFPLVFCTDTHPS